MKKEAKHSYARLCATRKEFPVEKWRWWKMNYAEASLVPGDMKCPAKYKTRRRKKGRKTSDALQELKFISHQKDVNSKRILSVPFQYALTRALVSCAFLQQFSERLNDYCFSVLQTNTIIRETA